MVSKPIPGIYQREVDNTLGMQPTGGGYIGVPAVLEKGEIGVPIYVRDTTDLKSLCGYPIVGFNQAHWLYVDNIFFYASNVAVARVETTDHTFDLEDREIVCGASNAQVGIWQSGHYSNPDLVEDMKKVIFTIDDTEAEWRVLSVFLDTNGVAPYDPQLENIDTSILIKNYVQDVDDKNIFTEENESREELRTVFSGASAFEFVPGAIIIDKTYSGSGSGATLSTIKRVSKVLDAAYMFEVSSSGVLADLARSIERDKTYGTIEWSGSGSTRKVISWDTTSRDSTSGFMPSYLETSGSGSSLAYWVKEGTAVYAYDATAGTLTQVGTVYEDTDITNGTKFTIVPTDSSVDITASTVLTFVSDDTYLANWAGIDNAFFTSFGTVTKKASVSYIHLRAISGSTGAYNGSTPAPLATNRIALVKDNAATGSFTIVDINTDNFGATMSSVSVTLNKELLRLVATTPGAWCDRENVTVTVSDMAHFDEVASEYFNYDPETSGSGYAQDQIAVIIKADGELVDTLIGSLNPTAKDDNGNSRYIVDILNRKQSWLYLGFNEAVITSPAYAVSFEPVEDVAISGGHASKTITADTTTTYTTASIALVQEAVDLFASKDDIDVTYLADGGWAGNQTVFEYLRTIAALTRRDCRVYAGPNPEDCKGFTTARAAWTNLASIYGTWVPLSNEDGQFADFYANAKQVYDAINDSYVWISCSSDAVGLHSQVDRTFDPWYPVAGNRRGGLKNVVKMAWNPDADIRVEMMKLRMIPIIYRRGEGFLIYDTINSYTKKSDLAENYNRKTLNYLQKNVENLCNDYVFEFNDATTRYQLTTSLEPFFRNVQSRRGLVRYAIQCDDKNNPAEVIDQNEMRVDIYLTLPRIAKIITISWILKKASGSLT